MRALAPKQPCRNLSSLANIPSALQILSFKPVTMNKFYY